MNFNRFPSSVDQSIERSTPCLFRLFLVGLSLMETVILAVVIFVLIGISELNDTIEVTEVLMPLINSPLLQGFCLLFVIIDVISFLRSVYYMLNRKFRGILSVYHLAIIVINIIIVLWVIGLVCFMPRGKRCTVEEMAENYTKYHKEMASLNEYLQSVCKDSSMLVIERDKTGMMTVRTCHNHTHRGYTYKYTDRPDYKTLDSVLQICGLTKSNYIEICNKMRSANVIGVAFDSGCPGNWWSEQGNINMLYRYAGYTPFRYFFINNSNSSECDARSSGVLLNDSVMVDYDKSLFGLGFASRPE